MNDPQRQAAGFLPAEYERELLALDHDLVVILRDGCRVLAIPDDDRHGIIQALQQLRGALRAAARRSAEQ